MPATSATCSTTWMQAAAGATTKELMERIGHTSPAGS
jgi:hypothetical protein